MSRPRGAWPCFLSWTLVQVLSVYNEPHLCPGASQSAVWFSATKTAPNRRVFSAWLKTDDLRNPLNQRTCVQVGLWKFKRSNEEVGCCPRGLLSVVLMLLYPGGLPIPQLGLWKGRPGFSNSDQDEVLWDNFLRVELLRKKIYSHIPILTTLSQSVGLDFCLSFPVLNSGSSPSALSSHPSPRVGCHLIYS